MKKIINYLPMILLTGCTINTGVGIMPDGPEYWEQRDPHFMILGTTKTKPIQAFYLHSCSVQDKDWSWGYNLVGISTQFDIGGSK